MIVLSLYPRGALAAFLEMLRTSALSRKTVRIDLSYSRIGCVIRVVCMRIGYDVYEQQAITDAEFIALGHVTEYAK